MTGTGSNDSLKHCLANRLLVLDQRGNAIGAEVRTSKRKMFSMQVLDIRHTEKEYISFKNR